MVKRFLVKMAKTGHLCFLLDTPTPRRKCARLGGPKTPSEKFLLRLGIVMLRLGEPLCLGVALLRLGQPTVLVLFFLRLILESVTFLFGFPMGDN